MSLNFGTLLLSKKASLRTTSLRTKDESSVYNSFYNVVYLVVGKFLFQRPDTHEILIEMPEGVIQEKAENVFIYNHANVEHFKGIVRELHEDRIEVIRKTIQDELDAGKRWQEKIDTLQSEISSLELKNLSDYSENRMKQIRGLSKNLRKHQRRLDGVKGSISNEEDRIKRIEKEMELSISTFDQTIELPKEKKA